MTMKKIREEIGMSDEDLDQKVTEAMEGLQEEDLETLYEESIQNFEIDSILKGRIVNVVGDDVVIDVGYKSEGVIPLNEFEDREEIDPGDEIEVLLEEVEDESGLIRLSKRKADRIRGWEKIISEKAEGDTVKGKVIRKIKGGLLVDIGVPVFLPASQVSIRRTGDISDYIGKEVECEIIKIDEKRMNIVVSRRRLIERTREKMKKKLLSEIKEGELRRGTVKNLADFGAFIDLGGIDGLLHITDMSWGRINHPSEMLSIDEEVDVKILRVDKERERIALGLKQKTESPWKDVERKYPIGSRVRGKVVNVMSYGAFVKLEDGIEGLVHISEMSWTKRINHPSEVVNIGDTVDVIVLDINQEKQEISLGMKQTEVNPWTLVEQNYPVGTLVEGRVRNLTNYGAFIEIEEGIDGLLHISDISWTKKVNHPSEILKKGDLVKAVVRSVDQERKRVALSMKHLESDPWKDNIPQDFKAGDMVRGRVTKLTNFGVFVELADDLEGLLHISELAEHKVKNPEEVVKVGDLISVRILRVDPGERKIGLSLIGVEERASEGETPAETPPGAAEIPPAEGEPPPAETPPGAAEIPPAEGEPPPAETAPGAAEIPPAEGEPPPAETAPSAAEIPPAEGEPAPAETAPSAAETPAAEGEPAPAEIPPAEGPPTEPAEVPTEAPPPEKAEEVSTAEAPQDAGDAAERDGEAPVAEPEASAEAEPAEEAPVPETPEPEPETPPVPPPDGEQAPEVAQAEGEAPVPVEPTPPEAEEPASPPETSAGGETTDPGEGSGEGPG
jgi:small subunit ribosomal protein S1